MIVKLWGKMFVRKNETFGTRNFDEQKTIQGKVNLKQFIFSIICILYYLYELVPNGCKFLLFFLVCKYFYTFIERIAWTTAIKWWMMNDEWWMVNDE